jgi:hypothetical protein
MCPPRALQALRASLGSLLAERAWQSGGYTADVVPALTGDAALSGALRLWDDGDAGGGGRGGGAAGGGGGGGAGEAARCVSRSGGTGGRRALTRAIWQEGAPAILHRAAGG